MCPYTEAKPYEIKVKHSILDMDFTLCENVMQIEPYVGIDYSNYRIGENIRGVLHGSYHSSTACVERRGDGQPYTKRSLLYLADRCRAANADLYLSPLPEAMRSTSGIYSTTAEIIRADIKPIFGLTNEAAYMKLCLAYSLGYEGEEIIPFLEREIAGELHRTK